MKKYILLSRLGCASSGTILKKMNKGIYINYDKIFKKFEEYCSDTIEFFGFCTHRERVFNTYNYNNAIKFQIFEFDDKDIDIENEIDNEITLGEFIKKSKLVIESGYYNFHPNHFL